MRDRRSLSGQEEPLGGCSLQALSCWRGSVLGVVGGKPPPCPCRSQEKGGRHPLCLHFPFGSKSLFPVHSSCARACLFQERGANPILKPFKKINKKMKKPSLKWEFHPVALLGPTLQDKAFFLHPPPPNQEKNGLDL